MQDKFCLVTGGTAGIGFAAARQLAAMGAAVTLIGRDRSRGEVAAAAIRAQSNADRIEFESVDLSNQAALRAFAESYLRSRPTLDVLVNNAGGLFGGRQLSADGIEMTFALNHLNYFLLTQLLLPALYRATTGRIVVVASEAHRGCRLDFDNLQGERRYRRWTAYKRSKLANLLFTYALARRLAGSSVTVNALHPGFVATDIGVRHGFVPEILWRIGKLAAISADQGADTIVHLATSTAVRDESGGYYIDRQRQRSSAASYDEAAAARLWEVSTALTCSRHHL